jgi:glutamyl-tRNA reductase
MVDLAVPRDIEPEVGELDDVFLYTVDDLAHVVQEGVGNRQAAAEEAETIIENRVADFMHWMEARAAVPTIRAIHDQAERYRRHEMERAQRALARGEDAREVLERMSRALANKFVHIPSHALNHLAGEERADLEGWLKRLYNVRPD